MTRVGELLTTLMLKEGQRARLEEGGAWKVTRPVCLRREEIVKFLAGADLSVLEAEVSMVDFRKDTINIMYRRKERETT